MKQTKNTSIKASFKNAAKGLWFCIKNERNMRIHTTCAVYVLVVAPFLGLSRAEYAVLFAVIGIMITAETFNTSIEKLCDFVCPQFDSKIGEIKDISAGAVFVSSLCAVCIGFVIMLRPKEILALGQNILSNPISLISLIISVVISLIYIFKGPTIFKAKKKGKL